MHPRHLDNVDIRCSNGRRAAGRSQPSTAATEERGNHELEHAWVCRGVRYGSGVEPQEQVSDRENTTTVSLSLFEIVLVEYLAERSPVNTHVTLFCSRSALRQTRPLDERNTEGQDAHVRLGHGVAVCSFVHRCVIAAPIVHMVYQFTEGADRCVVIIVSISIVSTISIVPCGPAVVVRVGLS